MFSKTLLPLTSPHGIAAQKTISIFIAMITYLIFLQFFVTSLLYAFLLFIFQTEVHILLYHLKICFVILPFKQKENMVW